MSKKKDQQVEGVPTAGAPIDEPLETAKKAARKAAKNPVEQAVQKAIDVEKSVQKVVKRAVKKPAAKATTPEPPAPESAVGIATNVETATDESSSSSSLMTDVVFRLHAHEDVREIVLVGDFNGWSQASHPMTRNGDSFEVTVPLERDRRYRYRYLIDGHHWENDWNADEYVPNEYGGDDSVRIV